MHPRAEQTAMCPKHRTFLGPLLLPSRKVSPDLMERKIVQASLFRCSLFRRAHVFVAQGDEFLGGARVDADRLVELLLGLAAFDGDRQSLDDLGRVLAEHVAADYALASRVDHELEEGALLASRECVFHRAEARLIDIDLAVLPPR